VKVAFIFLKSNWISHIFSRIKMDVQSCRSGIYAKQFVVILVAVNSNFCPLQNTCFHFYHLHH